MSVKEARTPPNQHLIKELEAALEQAKSGDMQFIAYAAIHRDGKTSLCWTKRISIINRLAIVGELECLKRDFMDSEIELRIDPETGGRSY